MNDALNPHVAPHARRKRGRAENFSDLRQGQSNPV